MLTNFGKFCRKIRMDNKETQVEMAERLGVSDSYLSCIEIGKRKPPANFVAQIIMNYKLTEGQIEELHDSLIIDNLSEKEKSALKAALSVIYLEDNSDYINGLWDVVRAILGDEVLDSDSFVPIYWLDRMNWNGLD